MKAIRSNRKITPFGGVVPVLKQIRDFKIPQLIRQSLGERPKQARYGYDDVIISWMITNLCGGMRLDHITKLRKNLSVIPNLKLCSHDTLGRVMKSLATEVVTEQSVERGKRRLSEIRRNGVKTYKRITTRKTNQHEPFNKLLIKLACRIGVLKPKVKYDLDLDATTIATRVLEANKNYKQFMGFSPMVGSIDNMPVFIEMRNGNVSPGARIKECTEACINNLKENNITIGRLRMDKGGFNLSTFELLNKENIKFCVGTPKSKSLMATVKEREDWKTVKIETALYSWDCETIDIMHTMTKSTTVFRIVALRVDRTLREKPKTPSGWTYGGKYAYKMIITNDFESSAEELFEFYNQRGTSEHTFTEVKQQFAWKYPPFSFMAENTVYLMVTSMTAILYQGLIRKFKKHVKQIRLNARLKDFIFTFMTVACEIIDDTAVFYDTDIPYEKIC